MGVYEYILEKRRERPLHFTLIDPDEQEPEEAGEIAKTVVEYGTDAIMVGGSGVDRESTDKTVLAIKRNVNVPVIIFPGNISDISPHADAIFFMTLLNSRSRYWLSLAQALGAFYVKKCGIEPIPMGYIIVESGTKSSVEFYGDANTIPRNKPKIAAAFALAAQYMGMKLVYLEAGSGAQKPVPPEMVSYVKKCIDIPLVVGGGIRDEKTARTLVKAGADIIVTGTVVEENTEKVKEIIKGVHLE